MVQKALFSYWEVAYVKMKYSYTTGLLSLLLIQINLDYFLFLLVLQNQYS